jgi:hypothetical protein
VRSFKLLTSNEKVIKHNEGQAHNGKKQGEGKLSPEGNLGKD